jgi:hypothetical protein
MTDSYLLLTPVLVLGVLALIRFIGCNWVFGVDETILGLPAPADIHLVPGDQSVTLSWDYDPQDAVSFTVIYGTVMGGPYPDQVTVLAGSSFQHTATVTGLVNGTKYFFVITSDTGSSDAGIYDSAEVSATPGVTPFIVTTQLGQARTNFTGLVGMAIAIGPTDVIVTQLGRIVGPANTQSHLLSIVEVGSDATLASVTIQMPAGPVGDYAFVALPQPVTLQAFRQYFVVSHEVDGGDLWHDLPTNVVTTTNVASITSGVANDDAAPGFTLQGGPNQLYVPVNFRY